MTAPNEPNDGTSKGVAPKGVKTMAALRWVLVGLAGLAAVASIAAYVRARHHDAGARVESAAQLWQCPMHPAIVQDHPGECPICGMTLVPKPKATLAPDRRKPAVPGLSPVDLTPERIQLIGMRTDSVKREALGGELRAAGVVAPSERGLAQITTRFAGWIQKLSVSATGDRVRRGQVLATVYSPEVLRAQQELLVARGWSTSGAAEPKPVHGDGLTAGLEANARRRLELLGISAQDIDDVLRTGKAAEALPMRSPVDGYVVAKNAVAGVAVQPGMVLFEVADLSQVWVNAEIYEPDIGRIHVGQKARLELASLPGETTTGKVQFIAPVVDPGTRTLRLRLEFRNRIDRNGPRLRPGMSGTVSLDLPATSGLTVPAEAVVDTGTSHVLFVAREGGRFEPRAVKVGARHGDRVEIASGVREGETVVTTGNFLLDSESRLRAAIEGQPAPEGR